MEIEMKTNLYRHYNQEGTLLYVGVSLSAVNRLAQHREHSSWFDEIATVKIETFDSRDGALTAETIAINEERPVYNIHKKTKDKGETKYEAAERSRNEVTRKIVNFGILYSTQQVADMFFTNTNSIKQLIETNKLGAIKTYDKIKNTRFGARRFKKYVVSGWQLIDFIEYSQKFGEFPFANQNKESE